MRSPIMTTRCPEADGTLRALRAGRPVDPFTVWTWCCRHPVGEETYRHVAERGGRWPDEPELSIGVGHNSGAAAVSGIGEDAATATASAQGSGSADPNPADPLAGLIALAQAVTIPVEAAREQKGAREAELLHHTTKMWDDACLWLTRIGEVLTQEQADKAANYAYLFAMLEKAAEEARTSEKAPSLRQGRLVDARWRPVLDAAGRAKARMKQALEPFLLQRLAALRGPDGLDPVEDKDWPRAGTLDRRVGLRRDRRLAIIDRASLQAAYRDDTRLWAFPAVEAALTRLAQSDLEEGRTVPGALLVEHLAAV
ncbi:hypothetical protein WDZ92_11575 [Nostoc sp. NIES-2111]